LIPSSSENKIKFKRKFIKLNKKKVADISSDDHQMLKLFYKSDVLKLSKLLGRDLKFWIE